MRILQISTSDYGGGAERAARDLHDGLLEKHFHSHLLLGRRRGADLPGTEALYSRDLLGGRLGSRARLYFEAATGRQASASKAFHRWWQARKQDWNVVVGHNLHGVYFDLDALPEVAQAQPVVLVLHDLWLLAGHCAYPMECGGIQRGCGACPDLRRVPSVWRDRTRSEWERKRRVLHETAPTLVCVSRWVEQQVRASALADLPRVVIPYGIPDAPHSDESRNEIRRRLGWPQDKRVYLYVSSGGLRGNAYKDPDTLIGAAIELRKTCADRDTLIVTAGGKREIGAELSPLVRQYGHVAGGLDDFYRAADYFVYPTKVETAGLVLVEAARAGLPAITVQAGGCPEIVKDGETGLVVPPGDPGGLAQAMRLVATMDAAALRHNARKRYLDLFTRERMIQSYIELFARLQTRGSAALPLLRT